MTSSIDILNSPAKLGELLTICTTFAELEAIIREQATTLAMQKHEIPGYTLVHKGGSRYVEAGQIIELGLRCPVSNLQNMLAALATQLGNVGEAKYGQLCEAAGISPQPDAVKQCGAKVFLRRDSK